MFINEKKINIHNGEDYGLIKKRTFGKNFKEYENFSSINENEIYGKNNSQNNDSIYNRNFLKFSEKNFENISEKNSKNISKKNYGNNSVKNFGSNFRNNLRNNDFGINSERNLSINFKNEFQNNLGKKFHGKKKLIFSDMKIDSKSEILGTLKKKILVNLKNLIWKIILLSNLFYFLEMKIKILLFVQKKIIL